MTRNVLVFILLVILFVIFVSLGATGILTPSTGTDNKYPNKQTKNNQKVQPTVNNIQVKPVRPVQPTRTNIPVIPIKQNILKSTPYINSKRIYAGYINDIPTHQKDANLCNYDLSNNDLSNNDLSNNDLSNNELFNNGRYTINPVYVNYGFPKITSYNGINEDCQVNIFNSQP